jgi:hypothetical protein
MQNEECRMKNADSAFPLSALNVAEVLADL